MHAIDAILFCILIIFLICLLIFSNKNILFPNLVTRSQRQTGDESNENAAAVPKKRSQSKKLKDAGENGNYCNF